MAILVAVQVSPVQIGVGVASEGTSNRAIPSPFEFSSHPNSGALMAANAPRATRNQVRQEVELLVIVPLNHIEHGDVNAEYYYKCHYSDVVVFRLTAQAVAV